MSGKIKTNDNTKKLILKERNKNNFLGCRKLAQLLEEKYSIKISKSTVNKIIKDQGIISKKGRKKDLSIYKKSGTSLAGLFIFKALEQEIGFFEEIVSQLKVIFPEIRKGRLRGIIFYITCCKYLGCDIEKSDSILKFCKIKAISLKLLSEFEEKLSRYTPVIYLTPLNKRIDMVYSLKFIFGNGKYLFSDAKLLNLKSQPNFLIDYAAPLFKVDSRLGKIESLNSIMIFAHPSVEYLSGLVFDFLFNLNSGIKKIELLGEKGKKIKEICYNNFNPSFLIGYVPSLVYKGIYFLEKPIHKKISFDPFSYLYVSNCYSEFLQHFGRKAFRTNNVLLRRSKGSFPCWGIITNSEYSDGLIQEYFYFWPYLEEVSKSQLVNKQSSGEDFDNKRNCSNFLPNTMVINSFFEMAKLMGVLSKIIKLRGINLSKDLLCVQGSISNGKKCIKIFIPKMELKLKKQINCMSIFVENKRLFVV